MSLLYDSYVRFMVWLGAEPPPGYEHLLTGGAVKPKPAPKAKAVPPPQPRPRPQPAPPPRPAPSPAPPPKTMSPAERTRAEELHKLLKSRVLGNEETVKRLVNAERTRNPGGSPLNWLEAANDRWQHDNRW